MGRARSGEGRQPALRWMLAALALLALGALTAGVASASASVASVSEPAAPTAAPTESSYRAARVCGASAPSAHVLTYAVCPPPGGLTSSLWTGCCGGVPGPCSTTQTGR